MTRLAQTSQGSGPACMLVHGWALNARVWGPLAERLQGAFRVHRVDLPGHGRSPGLAGGAEGWADALAEAAPGPALWIGWSLGALVTLLVALRHPAKVKGLVLVGATPRFVQAADWPAAMPAERLDDFAQRLEADYGRTLSRFLSLQVYGPGGVPAGARHLLRNLQSTLAEAPPSRAGLREGLGILRETDLRERLPGIEAPALVISGNRDRLSHPKASEWMAGQLPQGRALHLETAAHAPFLSHPDWVSRHVRRFAGVGA